MRLLNLSSARRNRAPIKIIVFILACVPICVMVFSALHNTLGPDPAEALAQQTGEWSWRFLLLTLLITPLRKLSSSLEWLQYRRMLGMFAFFYAVLHLLVYLVFLLGLQWQNFYNEALERPYISVGLLAFILMLPLAVTSTQGWKKTLGIKWKKLHQLIYVVVIAVLIHLWWQVRSDYSEAIFYTAVVFGLFVSRGKQFWLLPSSKRSSV